MIKKDKQMDKFSDKLDEAIDYAFSVGIAPHITLGLLEIAKLTLFQNVRESMVAAELKQPGSKQPEMN